MWTVSNKIIMKVSIMISLLTLMRGAMAECDSSSVIVRGRCYEKEVLLENLSGIRSLVVDFNTNVLYFTKNFVRLYDSSSCYLDLNTKEFGVIAQVGKGYAQTVDQVRHEVYISSRNGIYKFYYNNKTVERLGSNDKDITSMFYKDELYCMSWSKKLYTYENGAFAEVQETGGVSVQNFVIDKDGYIFYGNSSGVFGKTKGSENVDMYERGIDVLPLSVDVDGNVYLCYKNRFYYANKDKKTLESIGILLEWCNDLTFDKDNNIIYTAYDKIIKLKLKAQD